MGVAHGLGGCRDGKVAPSEPVTSSAAGGAALAAATKADGAGGAAGAAAAAKAAPFVPREPPEAWATWPMPNAQLPGLANPQSYDTTSNRLVVTDLVTNLMWQRDVENTFVPFDDAQRACAALRLIGHDDWRLPSRIELISLLDMARTQPSINTEAFPNAPPEWFWTSTTASDDPTSAWYVYFYAGYPKTDSKGNRFSYRCVRSVTPRVHPATHYEVLPYRVRDLWTGLTWQRAVLDKQVPLTVARDYCAHLKLGGKSGGKTGEKHGWRLPTEGELFTLVDESATRSPRIDAAAFPDTPGEPFWSSSYFANGPAMSWYVAFDNGDGRYVFPIEKHRVRCVQ